jgi:putative tryptophan/tyrosine transport system substrate-binding protein
MSSLPETRRALADRRDNGAGAELNSLTERATRQVILDRGGSGSSTRSSVFVFVPDPIGLGLVGGNATGLSLIAVDLTGQLVLLKEAVPNLSRVALVTDAGNPVRERIIAGNEKAAQDLGISLWPAEISEPADVEPVFAKMVTDRADGFALTLGPLLFNLRARIGAAALAHRLPAICFVGEEVPYGLLMSYGQDFPGFFRRAVAYTDKILKGAKPADLPVEQPTKFRLVLNLKAAKALGITFSHALLVSADELIGL